MLTFFRARRAWLKPVLWAVIIALGVTTVFLFVDPPGGSGGGLGYQEIAKVAGRPVPAIEYRRQHQQLLDVYRQVYQLDKQDPNIIKQLGIEQQALNQLISSYAIWYEAGRLGLDATPDEVAERIRNYPVFQEEGRFIGTERYLQILVSNNLTAAEFENQIRREILTDKFRGLVIDGVLVTPEEIRREFENRNQQVKVRYVSFSSENLDFGQVPDRELRAFYREKREQYKSNEERKIQYVTVEPKPDGVEVTEAQVEAEMESVATGEQVRARHILIRASEADEESKIAEARRRVGSLYDQLRSGTDFAELARRYSEDPNSATQGGDLGYFGRGDMVPQFEEVAFALNPGEFSEPFQTPYGFHILQLLEKSGGDEGGRRPAAEFQARLKAAHQQAETKAQSVASEAKAGASLEELAQKHNLTVRESEFFPLTQVIPGLGQRPEFNQQVFALEPEGVTDAHDTGTQFVVARLLEVRLSAVPRFPDIRERVLEDFKTERLDKVMREKAFTFSSEASQEGSFETLASGRKLKVTTTDFFSKGANVDETLRFSPELHDQAFQMSPGEVSPPIRIADQYVVFQLVEKTPFDELKFQQEKVQLADTLRQQKQAQFFSAYVQNVVDQLRKEDQIVINQPLLDQLTG